MPKLTRTGSKIGDQISFYTENPARGITATFEAINPKQVLLKIWVEKYYSIYLIENGQFTVVK